MLDHQKFECISVGHQLVKIVIWQHWHKLQAPLDSLYNARARTARALVGASLPTTLCLSLSHYQRSIWIDLGSDAVQKNRLLTHWSPTWGKFGRAAPIFSLWRSAGWLLGFGVCRAAGPTWRSHRHRSVALALLWNLDQATTAIWSCK